MLVRWVIIGRREEGDYDWDKSAYNQCWLLHRAIQTMSKAPVVGSIIECLGGSIYVVSKPLSSCYLLFGTTPCALNYSVTTVHCGNCCSQYICALHGRLLKAVVSLISLEETSAKQD